MLQAEPWLRREVTHLPPEKGAGGRILGKLRLRALTPPRGPSLSPGWPWVLLTGHPCSCLQAQSVTLAPRPGPGSLSAAPGPRPHWCWVSQGRAPAAHSWQRAGGWEPEKAASPRIPRRGRPSEPPPAFSAPSCHLPLSLLGERGGAGPHSCTGPSPRLPSQTSLLPQQTPGSVWGAHPEVLRGPPPPPTRCPGVCVLSCPRPLAAPGPSCPLYARLGGHLSAPPTGLRKALELSGQERGRRKEASWTVGTGVPGGGDGPGGHPPCPAFWWHRGLL